MIVTPFSPCPLRITFSQKYCVSEDILFPKRYFDYFPEYSIGLFFCLCFFSLFSMRSSVNRNRMNLATLMCHVTLEEQRGLHVTSWVLHRHLYLCHCLTFSALFEGWGNTGAWWACGWVHSSSLAPGLSPGSNGLSDTYRAIHAYLPSPFTLSPCFGGEQLTSSILQMKQVWNISRTCQDNPDSDQWGRDNGLIRDCLP
jgi:hypothetical protein